MKLAVKIKVKHFKDSDYVSSKDCPLARAYKEQYSRSNVFVYPESVEDDSEHADRKIYWLIKGEYGFSKYARDKFISSILSFARNFTVRTVYLENDEIQNS